VTAAPLKAWRYAEKTLGSSGLGLSRQGTPTRRDDLAVDSRSTNDGELLALAVVVRCTRDSNDGPCRERYEGPRRGRRAGGRGTRAPTPVPGSPAHVRRRLLNARCRGRSGGLGEGRHRRPARLRPVGAARREGRGRPHPGGGRAPTSGLWSTPHRVRTPRAVGLRTPAFLRQRSCSVSMLARSATNSSGLARRTVA